PFLPLVAAWAYYDWALVALLEENLALARSLIEEFHQIRVTTDAGSVTRENELIGALLASLDTDDSARLRALAAGLDRQMERAGQAGDWVRVAMVRLAVAHLHWRAGDHDE